eukprot:3475796-Pyramimonas_sp.AAC.1
MTEVKTIRADSRALLIPLADFADGADIGQIDIGGRLEITWRRWGREPRSPQRLETGRLR